MRRLTATVAAVAALWGAAAVAADFVVLESTVAGHAPGSLIAESERVALSSGDRLLLIDTAGATRTLRGPFSGAVGEGGAPAPDAIARLTASREDSPHVVGAIRAPRWDLADFE